jgi:integrase/recombinase XerD
LETEEFTLREMMEVLMGSDGKRKLRLHHKTNGELFELYQSQLFIRHRSKDALEEAKRVLGHFRAFLGEYPPNPELGVSFLAQFAGRKATTLYRYNSIIKSFMEWYGEQFDNKIKVPETLPDYVEDGDLDKLKSAMASKRTHKRVIERNNLIIDLICKTGLRRAEVSHLDVKDINLERAYLLVRQGKNAKDRIIDLVPSMVERLRVYIKGKNPEERVFNLKPTSISGMIKWAAQRAGVDIHTHSLRDVFATRLVDTGTDLEIVRRLLGHTNLNVTRRYIARTDSQRREAVNRLELAPKASAATPAMPKTIDWCIVGGLRVIKGSPEYFDAMSRAERRRQRL